MKVCMVSTYSISEGGVSSYTRNLVQALKERGVNVIIFSNKLKNEKLKQSCEGVYPVWDKGILYPFQIFKAMAANQDANIAHIQHEFFLYGGVFSALFFPVLLFLVRLLGKPVVVTMHHVIPLFELNERFKKENWLSGPLFLLKFSLILITNMIISFSDALIVHGKFFADVLYNDYKCPKKKIHVIPHGIEEIKTMIPQNEAKRRLGLENKIVILFFGYIAGYKGIETLIEAFGRLTKKYQEWILIIGGGEHPRLSLNPMYKEYLARLKRMAYLLSPGKCLFTGFIPNKELILYLSAADIIIFPYTTIMASSGALSLSISYEKPIIASNIPPIKELIPFKEVLFERRAYKELAEKLEQVLNNCDLKYNLSIYFKRIKEKNSWNNVALQTYNLYNDILSKHDGR